MPALRLLPALFVSLLAASLGAQVRVPLDGTWDLARDVAGGDPAYDGTVAVPAAFETALGDGFDGVAWCRRLLPLQPEWRGALVRVEFAAVATHARVLCNGTVVAEHLGAWTPFRAELTPHLRWDGTDELQVRVDERVGHNTQGFLPVVQPHFGGIWQSVTLCIDRRPVIDRLSLFTFGRLGNGQGEVLVRAAALPFEDRSVARVRLELLDGSRAIAKAEHDLAACTGTAPMLQVAAPRPWSPQSPNLYTLRLTALDGDGRRQDQLERRIGFRSLQAAGTTVQWNAEPLQVRGVLHWGYSPPHLAPPSDRAFWRRQLEDFRGLGFNLLKCCLWVPPPCVYELCDELGMLVWQEYPTWHPHMDQAHKDDLLREYAEFFLADGSHASVGFRSITCETGHGADLDVVQALYTACKAAVPDTLVVDDSSWIGWQRVADFWDEHPYGNNRWWPGRLADFERHQKEHGSKPLLLGECIAADTWVDAAEWRRRSGDALPWWRPDCLQDQGRFEAWLRREFGDDTLQSLAPLALDAALATRRYQIECLRRTIPTAGYVVSVARDFGKARMGLYDDFDRLKWSERDWAWHGETMLCLETEGDARGFVVSDAAPPRLHVRVARGAAAPVESRIALPPLPAVTAPTRHTLTAAAAGQKARWDVWLLPPFDDRRPDGVRVLDRLDEASLDWLLSGGRALLRVAGTRHALRSAPMWYLRGAPFAPPHPSHALLPAAMLLELQAFDLDGGRVMPWQPLLDQVDPILAFWETHDIAEVRAHLFAFDCTLGNGRLLASCLDRETPAGRYVEHALLQHLAQGPAPRRALSPDTLRTLRQLLTERTLALPTWRFRTDAEDKGLTAGFQRTETDLAAAEWRDLKAGSHWENQGEDLRHFTGVAWYAVDLAVPADWPELPARAVFEGVDDSFELWLDGESLGRRGDPATNTSIWLEPQILDLGPRLRPGTHRLVLRVVDHGGAGGLWKPAFVTTGPTGPERELLQ